MYCLGIGILLWQFMGFAILPHSGEWYFIFPENPNTIFGKQFLKTYQETQISCALLFLC